MPTSWTLFVDETGSFADLNAHVAVVGLLWRHGGGPNTTPHDVRSHLTAVSGATWPWHSMELAKAAMASPNAHGVQNQCFDSMRTKAAWLQGSNTVRLLVATESERGDVVPPICCRWRKLFRVLVERAMQVIALVGSRENKLEVSAQWLPFMQQRPHDLNDFRSRDFMGRFERLASQALHGLSGEGLPTKVHLNSSVQGASFAAGRESVSAGHVLVDFAAYHAGIRIRKAVRDVAAADSIETDLREDTGFVLQSFIGARSLSHFVASGVGYCDTHWLATGSESAVPSVSEKGPIPSWVRRQRNEWKGALQHPIPDFPV